MQGARATATDIIGELKTGDGSLSVQVLGAGPHTLFVKFDHPPSAVEFSALRLKLAAREIALGRCRYLPHVEAPLRRKNDPLPLGDGRIVFLEELYDFSSLERAGSVSQLDHRFEQLPVMWERKKEIRPAFREAVSETLYDLQVYRSVLDEIDRNLSAEPPAARVEMQRIVTDQEYPRFRRLFDQKIAELEAQARGFTQEEHERHGFYLRKHTWDLIRASEFLLRTNLKPRGYAGDSEMMRMLYENSFRGPTIFSRFMHRHPLETDAAQAVRNRVGLLSGRLTALASEKPDALLRVMSVASGPAWELKEIFRSAGDLRRFDFTLLDQDPAALLEAQDTVATVEARLGGKAQVRYLQDSVRTMLRTPDLGASWGRFSFLYSMGLFDYLTAPVAKAVLRKLYEALEPGGELVIGNFHPRNKTRLYMEYWMDWVLVYRTEDELHSLAEQLPGADVSTVTEATNSQVFLCVRKRS